LKIDGEKAILATERGFGQDKSVKNRVEVLLGSLGKAQGIPVNL